MKMFATPWVRTQTGGTTKAVPVMPDAASRIINNSKSPVIAVGAAINDIADELLDRVIKLHEKGIPVAATAHSVGFFKEKGVTDVYEIGIVELTNILTDPEWEGVDGNGLPDLVIVIGINLDLTNQTFQTLKNFTDIPSLSISRYFMANANYSFPNIDDEIWLSYLDELVEKVKEREQTD